MSHHGYDSLGRPILKLPGYLLELCRQLRQDETPPEEALWRCLRARRLFGLKFRRQHGLGRYIADFYCHEAGLVVELDGAVHLEQRQREYDAVRDRELTAAGARVARFANREVREDLPRVLRTIAEHAGKGPSPRRCAPPLSHRDPADRQGEGSGGRRDVATMPFCRAPTADEEATTDADDTPLARRCAAALGEGCPQAG
ncbi:endonuclease domain-containing protein [bacterium]|nr:endonuclease domain-containing protein [bacterium]